MPNKFDAFRAQRGASRKLNFKLCRFIPAYKAGLARHLPVKCQMCKNVRFPVIAWDQRERGNLSFFKQFPNFHLTG